MHLENQIVELYNSGLNIKNISLKLQMSREWVGQLLKRHLPNNKARKYFFNESYFKEIDTEAKAYFLGLLFADGSIGKNYLTISLQERDSKILEKLAEFVEYTGPIRNRIINDKNYAILQLNSSIMVKDLMKLGINHSKTKNPDHPVISQDLFLHFLRGFSDGDGTIYSSVTNKRKVFIWKIIIHDNLVDWFSDNIKKLIPNFNFQIGKHHKTTYIKILNTNGTKNVKCVLLSLYKNATIYLERKYDKYLELLEYINQYANNPQNKTNKLTKYRGVSLERKTGKFCARIKQNNICIHLGTFQSQEEAALAYNEEAIKYRGDAAIINIL